MTPRRYLTRMLAAAALGKLSLHLVHFAKITSPPIAHTYLLLTHGKTLDIFGSERAFLDSWNFHARASLFLNEIVNIEGVVGG